MKHKRCAICFIWFSSDIRREESRIGGTQKSSCGDSSSNNKQCNFAEAESLEMSKLLFIVQRQKGSTVLLLRGASSVSKFHFVRTLLHTKFCGNCFDFSSLRECYISCFASSTSPRNKTKRRREKHSKKKVVSCGAPAWRAGMERGMAMI